MRRMIFIILYFNFIYEVLMLPQTTSQSTEISQRAVLSQVVRKTLNSADSATTESTSTISTNSSRMNKTSSTTKSPQVMLYNDQKELIEKGRGMYDICIRDRPTRRFGSVQPCSAEPF